MWKRGEMKIRALILLSDGVNLRRAASDYHYLLERPCNRFSNWPIFTQLYLTPR